MLGSEKLVHLRLCAVCGGLAMPAGLQKQPRFTPRELDSISKLQAQGFTPAKILITINRYPSSAASRMSGTATSTVNIEGISGTPLGEKKVLDKVSSSNFTVFVRFIVL